MSHTVTNTPSDPRWRDLYKIAGIAAVISELVILLGFVIYFIWPYTPGKNPAESIFLLLQSNPLGWYLSTCSCSLATCSV